jgi:hypothetical protein
VIAKFTLTILAQKFSQKKVIAFLHSKSRNDCKKYTQNRKMIEKFTLTMDMTGVSGGFST